MSKPRVYISGKITGLALDEARDNFLRHSNLVGLSGCEPVNPMEKVSEQEGKTYKEYMLEDISIPWDCDGIYMLPNWRESTGARIELAIALELGKPVTFGK